MIIFKKYFAITAGTCDVEDIPYYHNYVGYLSKLSFFPENYVGDTILNNYIDSTFNVNIMNAFLNHSHRNRFGDTY